MKVENIREDSGKDEFERRWFLILALAVMADTITAPNKLDR
jgi:hypothetical protein